MSILSEYQSALKRLKKDARKNVLQHAKLMKIPYQTILYLVNEKSMGTVKTWARIEKFYAKQDKP
jgi:hypothetical protein